MNLRPGMSPKGSPIRQSDTASPGLDGFDSNLISSTKLGKAGYRDTMTNLACFNESHIFTWFAAIPKDSRMHKRQAQGLVNITDARTSQSVKARQSFLVDGTKVEGMLTDMHSFLCSSRFKKHREYRRCPSNAVGEVDSACQERIQEYQNAMNEIKSEKQRRTRRREGDSRGESQSGQETRTKSRKTERSDSDGPTGTSAAGKRRLNQRVSIMRERKLIKLSKTLFQFFLPLDFRSDMVLKYWGAIKLILQV